MVLSVAMVAIRFKQSLGTPLPKFDQAGWGHKNRVNTGDRFTDPHSKKPSKRDL